MEQWKKDARREPIIVDIEALVPKAHLLRKIEQVMDYDWLYERLDPYYCHDNGRPGTDPVVLIKMVLIQHLYGIPSLRQTHQRIEDPKPTEGFAGMEILGTKHAEKESAGKAIIDVCTKMTGSDAVALGQYRGFSLTLAYDGASNEYRMTMRGTLSHTVVLGADVFGNITRMDNALEGFTDKLSAVREDLESNKTQLENARSEMETPFAREEELQQKTERLKELNILLNMDRKDRTLMDDEPETEEPERKAAGLER